MAASKKAPAKRAPKTSTTRTTAKPPAVAEVENVTDGAGDVLEVDLSNVEQLEDAPETPRNVDLPAVQLSHVVQAAKSDPWRPAGRGTPGITREVSLIEEALKARGYLPESHVVTGAFTGHVICAYSTFQNLGLNRWGDNASGIPDEVSLRALGEGLFEIVL